LAKNGDCKCYDAKECCEEYFCESSKFPFTQRNQSCEHNVKDCCEGGQEEEFEYKYEINEKGEKIELCCNTPNHDTPRTAVDPKLKLPFQCCSDASTPKKGTTITPLNGGVSCCGKDLVINENGACEPKECPCVGCCDFNCCDELDYFMHVAFNEAYSKSATGVVTYPEYKDFFNAWYKDFYHWWNPEDKQVQ
jgi:hypothetical protein